MAKDLTASPVDRQNILNNQYALSEIEKATQIQGIPFEGRTVVIKEQIADFFEVTTRTVDNYLERFDEELAQNGYEVLKGKRLKKLKLAIQGLDVHETDFVNILKTPQLGIFDFRAFLNLAMLMVESDRARLLRKTILDIVIDTINQRTGGGTKYINQRDEDFLEASFVEENYRKKFTDALRDCVAMGKFKYPMYTNKIYVSIFKEKAQEYRQILKLEEREEIRTTLYSEVLDVIAAYENGFAEKLREKCRELGRPLSNYETDDLFEEFERQPHWEPLIHRARGKMASRDLAFRDALHQRLEEYIGPLSRAEFERFLGDRSMEFDKRLEEAKDVMKRLKERE